MNALQFLSKRIGIRIRPKGIFWHESKIRRLTPEEVIESQNKMLLNHLMRGWTVTPIDAMELFGILRLGARIWDLRKKGYSITTTLVKDGNKRYASYKLIKS